MSMAMAYGMKKRQKKMAEGGDVKAGKDAEDNSTGVHKRSYSKSSEGPGASDIGHMVRNDPKFKKTSSLGLSHQNSMREGHKQVLREAKAAPRPTGGVAGFAHGGDVSDHEQDADMIARIMHKRKQYSEGGQVANDNGVAEADHASAEFDDLVLDDHLDFHETGANSGDEDGSKLNQDTDLVGKIMRKRKS
jgi:hypothetical protein